MATVNAISVALFNAAAGGYSSQIYKDPNSIANAVGLILERDISTDAQFVDHLLANFGVLTSMSVYGEAKRALDNLVYSVGRGQATTIAIDFLKMNEGAANDYGIVALNFALKVNSATQYSTAYPNERDISKLVSVVTGVDTDQIAINNALSAVNPSFSANLTAALAAAEAKAAADKAAEIAALKVASDAALKNAADKAAADLKAANDKAVADAATAKALADKALADANAALKLANDKAAEAAIKAATDKAAALGTVDKTTDNAAAITAYLKAAAAVNGLTGYDSMTDSQLLAAIKASDNQVIAVSVDKTIDNPQAITTFLRTTANALGISGTSTMGDADLLNAIKTSNDVTVANQQKLIDDTAAANLKAQTDATISNLQTSLQNAQNSITTAVNNKNAENQLVITSLTNQLNAAQNLAGKTFNLNTDNDTVMAVSGGNDTVNASFETYGSDDVIVDTSTKDNDTLILTTTKDITATPVVVGFENINVTVPSVFAGSDTVTTLEFNADNIRTSTLNFDATNIASLVTDVKVTKVANLMSLTSSLRFTSVDINGDANASLTYQGLPTTLVMESTNGALNNVKATITKDSPGTVSTDATGTLTLITSTDTNVTASDAAAIDITSSGQVTLSAASADVVTVIAAEEAIVTANSAENVTIFAGDGIDSTSSTAIDSRFNSSNANNTTVNLQGKTAPIVLDINGAPKVNKLVVSGTNNVSIKVGLDDIDGLGTATNDPADDNLLTVINGISNSATVNLLVTTTGGDADFSAANVTNIQLNANLTANDEITIASNASIVSAYDQTNPLTLYAKNPADINTVRISIKDDLSSEVTGDLIGGIALSNFKTATLTNNDTTKFAILGNVAASGTDFTIASGVQGFKSVNGGTSYSINLGTGVLKVTGVAPVNLGSSVTAASVAAGDAAGAITLGLTGSGTVGTVITGTGDDVLTIKTNTRTAGAVYTLNTGAGSDTLELELEQGFTWNGDVGNDTLKVNSTLDLSSVSVSLTSINAIWLDTGNNGTETLTLNASTFQGNNVFALYGGADSPDFLVVKGTSDPDTINAYGVSVVAAQASLVLNGYAGNDVITGSEFADTLNGGAGADTLSGGDGSDTYIFNENDVVSGESITETVNGSGTDVVSVVTTTDFRTMTADSFNDLEVIKIAANKTATFTSAQLTQESITLSGDASGTETVEVIMSIGGTFTSGLSGSNVDIIKYTGSTGAETITGGALPETIKGGELNDVLTGGGGIDTYVFSIAAENGMDSIVFSDVGGSNAVEDILDFSAITFVGGSTSGNKDEVFKVFSDANVAVDVLNETSAQNILVLTRSYFASATALATANTKFTDCATGNVLILYANSSSEDTRIALCGLNDAGDVITATDMAVLIGMTIDHAATGLSANNFILG